LKTRALALPLGAAAIAVAAIFLSTFGAAADEPTVGKAPPEIKSEGYLNASDPVSLEALKGKVVVVEFWATWCPPCRKSIPHLIEIHKKRAAEGLVIVGLSDEPKATVEPFAKKLDIPYIIGYGAKSLDAYGVEGIPTAFVIGADGNLVWSGHPMDKGFEKAIDEALAAAGKSKKASG